MQIANVKDVHRLGGVRPLLWLCSLCMLIFTIWACWAEIHDVTRGQGTIIPASRLQTIQSLEGGIVDQILVSEGDRVYKGQPLIRFDTTRFNAAYMEGVRQISALQATIQRLEAEVKGADSIHFGTDVAIDPEDKTFEQSLFMARKKSHESKIDSLTQRIKIVEREIELLRPLVEASSVSEMELLRLKKELGELRGSLADVISSYMQETYTELVQKRAELSVLRESLVQRKDQLERTEILSPVDGQINNILVTTRGGVVQPGEVIMEVLPIDDQLLVEAKIAPEDIAFLAPGMRAKVKITAYDFAVYGDLDGEVIQISPDTIEEETKQGKEYYYQILVRTEGNFLERDGVKHPIRPGMITQVDVLGDKRTVMHYLLKPLLRANLN